MSGSRMHTFRQDEERDGWLDLLRVVNDEPNCEGQGGKSQAEEEGRKRTRTKKRFQVLTSVIS